MSSDSAIEFDNMQDILPNSSDSNFTDRNFSVAYNYIFPEEQPEMHSIDIALTFYIPPILIPLGTFSNIFTFIIAQRKVFRGLSSSFYLSCYCIANLLTLYLFLGAQWITDMSDVKPVEMQTDWLCPVWQFVIRVVSYSGIWFIVAMSIDRYIIVWHPWKVSSMCTKFIAKFVGVIIVVGLVVISVHAMWTFKLMANGCYTWDSVDDLHAIMWPWMSTSFYSFIPLTLLFVFFVLILTGLCLKRPYKHHDHDSHGQNYLIFTNVTLGLAGTYFALTLPPTIINIVHTTFPPSWLQDQEFLQQIHQASMVGLLLGWANTVTVFPICLLLSQTFRSELMDIVRKLLCLRHQGQVYELQTGSHSSATQVDINDTTLL